MSKKTNIGVRGNNLLFFNILEMLERLHKRINVEGITVFSQDALNHKNIPIGHIEQIRYSYQLNTQDEVYKLKLMLYYLDPERYEKEAAHLFEWCEINKTDLPYNIRPKN